MKNIPRKLLLLVLTLVIGITLVACGNNKDEEAVKKAVSDITVATEVSANFDLPAKSGDVTIVWTVEGDGLALGTVANDKQPVTVTQTESDQSATLKATFKLNKASDTKTYPVKVKAKAPVGKTDAEKVADAITKVTVAGEVTANFDVPTKQDEVGITWTVSGNGLALGTAANDKLPVTVTRTDADQEAILTAVFKLGQVSETKTYTVKVVKKDLVGKTDEEIVNEAIASVTVATEVDGNFQVPTKIGDVVVTWEASGAGLTLGAIADGMQTVNVTRTDADQQATLKAVFKLRQVTKDKTYTVKVLLEGLSEEDIVDGVKAGYVVPETVTEDFTLDLKVNNVDITFELTGDGIVKGEVVNGKQTFVVTRTDADQVVAIEVTFALGQVSVKGTYNVTVTKELPEGPKTARAYHDNKGASGGSNFEKNPEINQAGLINLDPNIFEVYAIQEASHGNAIGLSATNEIRLYADRVSGDGNELIIIIKEGYEIISVEYSFKSGNNSPFMADLKLGSTKEALKANDIADTRLMRSELSINGFSLKNSQFEGDSSTQIWIEEINIVYKEGTPESILGGGDVDPELTDQEKVDVAVADVIFTNKEIKEDTTLDLLTKGLHDVIISWEATTGLDYINLETGKVTLPTTPGTYDLVLEATFKLGGVEELIEYTFELIVPEPLGEDFIIHEDFEGAGLTASYTDNTFVGEQGTVFTYTESRNEAAGTKDDSTIDGAGITLRGDNSKATTKAFDATLSFKVNGLSFLYFEYRKAFSGTTGRALELYINDELVQTTEVFGSGSGYFKNVYTMVYENKHEGEVNVVIKTKTNGQVTIDNLYVYGPDAVVPKLHTVNFDTVDRDVEILDGTQVRLPDAPKAPVNYKFAGWTLDGVIYDFDLPVTKDLNLTAKFEILPEVTVKTLEDLILVLANENVEVINLGADITTNETILIDRNVVINGGGFTIEMPVPVDGKWQSGNAYILHVYDVLNVEINNIKLIGGNAGLLVNGSVVAVTDITLENHTHGGIEVSRGENVSKDPQLTVTGLLEYTLEGNLPVIWIDGMTTNDLDWVSSVEGLKEVPYTENGKEQLWFVFDDISIALVKDLDELLAALDNVDVETIILTADITTENTIVINNAVTIQGEGFSIEMTGERTDWVSGNAFVLQAYLATNVVIENLTLKGGNAGLLVNGSTVTIENLVLEGQTHGGIEVSQGNNVTEEPKLTVLGTIEHTFTNMPVIWLDKVTVNNGWVVQTGLTEEINGTQLWFVEKKEQVIYMNDFETNTNGSYIRNGTTNLGVENGLIWTIDTGGFMKDSGILWNYNAGQDTNITEEQGNNIARLHGKNTTKITSNAIDNVTHFSLDAKFYGTRTDSILKVFVKGDGDSDFVLIEQLELLSTFKTFEYEINRTNVQIRIEASKERSNIDNIKIYG